MDDKQLITTKIIIASMLVFAGGLYIIQPVQAHHFRLTASSYSDGYNRGYSDGQCDVSNCNGHGYDASCPSGHTETYCGGYNNGYNNGWKGNANGGFDNGIFRNANSQSNAAAIDGNNIKGDNNIINQQVIQSQRHNSDNEVQNDNTDNNNDHNDGGDGSGQLPSCKNFCLGIQ